MAAHAVVHEQLGTILQGRQIVELVGRLVPRDGATASSVRRASGQTLTALNVTAAYLERNAGRLDAGGGGYQRQVLFTQSRDMTAKRWGDALTVMASLLWMAWAEAGAPDLPGFGDSACPAGCSDADHLPPWLEQGTALLLGPQAVDVVNPQTGLLERQYLDPDTGQTMRTVPRNLPPNLPPTYESGQVPMTGGGIGMIPRGAAPGTPPVRLPGAQQKPSASSTKVPDPKKSERAREAAAFSKDVKARISEKAKAGKNIVTGALGLVSDADKDRITSEVTQGRFQSYTDLIRAEQGLDAGSAPPPVRTGGFGSPEGANAIADALKRRKQR